jgi:hypothetical protein
MASQLITNNYKTQLFIKHQNYELFKEKQKTN